jgi:hypothetical protein
MVGRKISEVVENTNELSFGEGQVRSSEKKRQVRNLKSQAPSTARPRD